MRLLIPLLLALVPLSAASVSNLNWQRDYSDGTAQEHYDAAQLAMERNDWQKAAHELRVIRQTFGDSPLASRAAYYLGVSEFERGEYDAANDAFSAYLKEEGTPSHFDEVFRYKLRIARAFAGGYRKRVGEVRGMPRWQKAQEDAIEIFGEIATALPSHELAAECLFAQAGLHAERKEFTEAIEKYQQLISRFPKHPCTPQSYLAVAQIYLRKTELSPQDPDLIALAQLNLRRFRQDFPLDERHLRAEGYIEEQRELVADALFETGDFYQRTKKRRAAYVYFASALRDYPDTRAAKRSRQRLEKMRDIVEKMPGGDALLS